MKNILEVENISKRFKWKMAFYMIVFKQAKRNGNLVRMGN